MKISITILLILATVVSSLPLSTIYPDQEFDENTQRLSLCQQDLIANSSQIYQQLNKDDIQPSTQNVLEEIQDDLKQLKRVIQVIIKDNTKRIDDIDQESEDEVKNLISYFQQKYSLYSTQARTIQQLLYRMLEFEQKLQQQIQDKNNQLQLQQDQVDEQLQQDLIYLDTLLDLNNKNIYYSQRLKRLIIRVLRKLSRDVVQFSLEFFDDQGLLENLQEGNIVLYVDEDLAQGGNNNASIEECVDNSVNSLNGIIRNLENLIQQNQLNGQQLSDILGEFSIQKHLVQRLIKNLQLRYPNGVLNGLENPVRYLSQAFFQLDIQNLELNFQILRLQEVLQLLQQVFQKVIDLLEDQADQDQILQEIIDLLDGNDIFQSTSQWSEKIEQVQSTLQTLQELNTELTTMQNNVQRSQNSIMQRLLDTLQLIEIPQNTTIPHTHDEEQTCFGDFCLTKEELQQCQEVLEKLDNKNQNNTSITNECTPFVENEEQFFKFTVQYQAPFVFDENCLNQVVKFEDIELTQGENFLDQFQFDSVQQQLVFNIALKDFDDKYNCQFSEESDQYVWLCEMSLHILLGPLEQLQYDFKIQVELDRFKTDSVVVTISKNKVEGICCENSLNIQTELMLCTDISCDSFLQPPYVVQRKEPFYVLHQITTSQFQDYYLLGLQIKIGQFLPQIISQDGSQPGRYIYEISSNIAKQGLLIEVISQIHVDDPSGRRRFLMSEEEQMDILQNDYKVNSYQYVDVKSQEDYKTEFVKREKIKQAQQKTEKITIMAVVVGLLLLVLCIVVGIKFYLEQYRKKIAKQQKQKQPTPSSSQPSSSSCYQIKKDDTQKNNQDDCEKQQQQQD